MTAWLWWAVARADVASPGPPPRGVVAADLAPPGPRETGWLPAAVVGAAVVGLVVAVGVRRRRG